MYKLDSEYDIHANFHFKSLCICYVNSGYLHTKQTEISNENINSKRKVILFFSCGPKSYFTFFAIWLARFKAVEPMFLFLKIENIKMSADDEELSESELKGTLNQYTRQEKLKTYLPKN